ncbi:MAG TPA: hypothetical protein VLR47_09955 [Rhodospirillales bacterium]|nr:hypothetical protein [Rhodospirillales bacterium]
MNTRMLLTAVLRNRRSQWTLQPKDDAPGPDAAGESEGVTAAPLQPAGEGAGTRRIEPGAGPR